jgi:hypothetical protein
LGSRTINKRLFPVKEEFINIFRHWSTEMQVPLPLPKRFPDQPWVSFFPMARP